MVPEICILVPLYYLASWTGVYDSYGFLILVYAATQVPTMMWFLKGFFEALPRELDEAAQIDGCTPWTAFYRVILPLAKPGLAAAGWRVARFEFPYMAERRRSGQKRPPDREPVLRETWLRVITRLGREGLVIGGKSMGGRIASLLADEAKVAGLVCLGYPFHPTGKSDQLRVEHLRTIQTPTFIAQGTRDPFGT